MRDYTAKEKARARILAAVTAAVVITGQLLMLGASLLRGCPGMLTPFRLMFCH